MDDATVRAMVRHQTVVGALLRCPCGTVAPPTAPLPSQISDNVTAFVVTLSELASDEIHARRADRRHQADGSPLLARAAAGSAPRHPPCQ
jgi:hypothetical protein